MLILPRNAIARLAAKGTLDVWSPRETLPATNVIHVVRARRDGETVTRARVLLEGDPPRPQAPREAVLQDLVYPEAIAAGFRTRDEFYGWWRKRYATGPLMTEPVLCWVTTYERVQDDIPQFMARGGGYTTRPLESVDVGEIELDDGEHRFPLQAVTDERSLREWARKAEDDRLGRSEAAKARWRQRRRFGRDAA